MVRRGIRMTIKEVSEQLGITQTHLDIMKKLEWYLLLEEQKEELEIIKKRI